MKFVAEMDQAVRFYRDTLGLPLKFQSPGWSEIATGDVTLALHRATPDKPAGSVEPGFHVDGLEQIYAQGKARRAASPSHRRRAASTACCSRVSSIAKDRRAAPANNGRTVSPRHVFQSTKTPDTKSRMRSPNPLKQQKIATGRTYELIIFSPAKKLASQERNP